MIQLINFYFLIIDIFDKNFYLQDTQPVVYFYLNDINNRLIYARIPKDYYSDFKKRIDGNIIKLKKKSEIPETLQAESEKMERFVFAPPQLRDKIAPLFIECKYRFRRQYVVNDHREGWNC